MDFRWSLTLFPMGKCKVLNFKITCQYFHIQEWYYRILGSSTFIGNEKSRGPRPSLCCRGDKLSTRHRYDMICVVFDGSFGSLQLPFIFSWIKAGDLPPKTPFFNLHEPKDPSPLPMPFIIIASCVKDLIMKPGPTGHDPHVSIQLNRPASTDGTYGVIFLHTKYWIL